MAAGFSILITANDKASAKLDAINKRLAAAQAPAKSFAKQLSKFSELSGIKKVGDGFQQIARNGVGLASSLARVVEPLAAITGAASLAGMVRLTQVWSVFGSQLGNTAVRIGVSATQLQALQGAAVLSGASASSMTTGLQTLGQTMYDAIGGRAPQAVALMNQLGIAFNDGTNHARSVTDVLPELADKIARIKDPFTQARVATSLFGGAAEDLLPFLRRGSAGIADYTEQAKKSGLMNQNGIQAANALLTSFAKVELSVSGLGNSIAESLAPVLTPLLGQLSGWIDLNREFIASKIGEYVKQFGAWVKTIDFGYIADTLQSALGTTNSLVDAMGGWKTVLEGVVGIKLASWAAGSVLQLTSLLRLLALVPGSGVTTAGLAAAGLAGIAGIALDASKESEADKKAATAHRTRGGGRIGKNVYQGASSSAANGGVFDWIDRRLQDLGIEGKSGSDSKPFTPNLGQSDAQKEAMAFFQSPGGGGWSKAQAAGLVANLQSESGLNPKAVGDGGGAYGIGQWHRDRQTEFARMFGYDIRQSTLGEQLSFSNYELTSGNEQGAGKRLRGAQDPTSAGAIVSRYYERPAAADEAARNRGALAAGIFGGGAPAALASRSTGAASADGRVGVHIRVSSDDGLKTKVSAHGRGSVGQPKIETAMNGMVMA